MSFLDLGFNKAIDRSDGLHDDSMVIDENAADTIIEGVPAQNILADSVIISQNKNLEIDLVNGTITSNGVEIT